MWVKVEGAALVHEVGQAGELGGDFGITALRPKLVSHLDLGGDALDRKRHAVADSDLNLLRVHSFRLDAGVGLRVNLVD